MTVAGLRSQPGELSEGFSCTFIRGKITDCTLRTGKTKLPTDSFFFLSPGWQLAADNCMRFWMRWSRVYSSTHWERPLKIGRLEISKDKVGQARLIWKPSKLHMESMNPPQWFFWGIYAKFKVGMYILCLFIIPFIHLCHCWFLRWYFPSNCAVHSRLLVTLPHIRQITGRRSNSDGVDESERQTDRGLRSPGVSKSYLPDFLSGCHGLYKLRLCRVTGPARLAEVSVNICIC